MTKIMIAGLGSIGRRHLRNLQDIGYKELILYRSNRSTLPDAELDGLLTESDLGLALAHQPEVVRVSNPTALHLPVATAAAYAGCHLFIEKPVSHNLSGLDELTSVVNERGLKVGIGFQFRFHPGLLAIRRFLDDCAIGQVVYARVQWGEYLPSWHPWEDYRQSYSARSDLGGGVVLTLCHPFDYLRWLLGEVDSVSATTGHLGDLKIDVEDTADVTLSFQSGAIGYVHLDYLQNPPLHTLQIVGQQGTIQWDSADGAVRYDRADTDGQQRIPVPPEFVRNVMFINELRHFLDCVNGEHEPAVGLSDGIRTLEIALAAKHSAREKKPAIV